MAQLYAKVALIKIYDHSKNGSKMPSHSLEMVGDEADTFPCVPGRQGFFSIIYAMDLSVICGETGQ